MVRPFCVPQPDKARQRLCFSPIPFSKPAQWVMVMLIGCLCSSRLLRAQEREVDLDLPENIDVRSLTELRVRLTGEDGQPVVGAAVMPYAMRMVEGGGHGFWNVEKLGPPPNYYSDATGTATIKYPAKVHALPNPKTTRLVTFQVRHSDFVSKVVHQDLGPDMDEPLQETEVQLKKGCELQLSAVDENGQPVNLFGVVMAGPYQPEFWADDGEGGKRTSSLNDGTWQTMLVAPQLEGPTLFSGLLPLRVRPSQALRIRNVKLTPGARLTGSLSDKVPRPIVDGYVMTTFAPKPAGDSWAEQDPSVTWHDWTAVKPDGTFEFPSVPRSGKVQIIALCEGWVSTTDIPEARGHFVMGNLFDVEESDNHVEVAMEPTGVLELSVLTPDGEPLQEGKVSTWPNQKYYLGGSTLLGRRFRSLDGLRQQLLPPEERKRLQPTMANIPYVDRPIKDGLARLSGIPLNRREPLALYHEDFKLKTEGPEEYVYFQLPSAEPLKMTLTVVPHQQTGDVSQEEKDAVDEESR